jgi:hypothetical protein
MPHYNILHFDGMPRFVLYSYIGSGDSNSIFIFSPLDDSIDSWLRQSNENSLFIVLLLSPDPIKRQNKT